MFERSRCACSTVSIVSTPPRSRRPTFGAQLSIRAEGILPRGVPVGVCCVQRCGRCRCRQVVALLMHRRVWTRLCAITKALGMRMGCHAAWLPTARPRSTRLARDLINPVQPTRRVDCSGVRDKRRDRISACEVLCRAASRKQDDGSLVFRRSPGLDVTQGDVILRLSAAPKRGTRPPSDRCSGWLLEL